MAGVILTLAPNVKKLTIIADRNRINGSQLDPLCCIFGLDSSCSNRLREINNTAAMRSVQSLVIRMTGSTASLSGLQWLPNITNLHIRSELFVSGERVPLAQSIRFSKQCFSLITRLRLGK